MIESIIISSGTILILSVLFAYRMVENRYGYVWAERLRIVQTFLLLVLFLSHGIYTIGLVNILGFIAISIIISGTFEIIGVNKGWIFGPYHYNPPSCPLPAVMGVPLCYPIGWCGMTYAAFWMGALLMNTGSLNQIIITPVFILLVAGLVTLLDIISDPIAVDEGRWSWHKPGAFYGVPLSNFIGWFFTAVVILATFSVAAPVLSNSAGSPFLGYLPAFGYIVFLFAASRPCFERKLPVAGYIALAAGAVLTMISITKYLT